MSDARDHDGHAAHDHGAFADPEAGAPTYFQRLERALRELLIEKGLITADDVRAAMEAMDARGEALGARMVARAWHDPGYRERLLADGSAAARELGIETGALRLVVVENTERVHNVIVCTLCSCYPRMILGTPPAWYKSVAYRSRAVREPRALLAEFGTIIPDDVAVRVHDSTADMRYMVLPRRPPGSESMSEEACRELVTRDSMIGVTIARSPHATRALRA